MQKNQVKVTLSYLVSLRPACASRNPVFKRMVHMHGYAYYKKKPNHQTKNKNKTNQPKTPNKQKTNNKETNKTPKCKFTSVHPRISDGTLTTPLSSPSVGGSQLTMTMNQCQFLEFFSRMTCGKLQKGGEQCCCHRPVICTARSATATLNHPPNMWNFGGMPSDWPSPGHVISPQLLRSR